MGIGLRHVVWTSAACSLGAFFYVLTLEPMNQREMPRAGAIDRVPGRGTLVLHIRNSLANGQLSTADRQSRELLSHHPEDLDAAFYRALTMRAIGRDREAHTYWVMLENLTEGLTGWSGRYTREQIDYRRAWALWGMGREEEARALFNTIADRIIEAHGGSPEQITDAFVHYNLACYRAMGGEHDRALRSFARAVEHGYGAGSDSGWWMVDPDLEALHSDDRFWLIGSRIHERDTRQDPRAEHADDRAGDRADDQPDDQPDDFDD